MNTNTSRASMPAMDKRLRLLAVAALGLAAASCATTAPDQPSAYGAFLAARYAGTNADAVGAAAYYSEALARDPGNPMLTDRAFVTALLAGEMDRASALAAEAFRTGDAGPLAALYMASDLIERRRYGQAADLLESDNQIRLNGLFSEMLLHWAWMGEGRTDDAIAAVTGLRASNEFTNFVVQHRARVFEVAGLDERADIAYRTAVFSAPNRAMVTQDYGGFLERNGQREEAIGLYESYLAASPGDAWAVEALDRVRSGGRAPSRPPLAVFAARSGFGPVMSEIASGSNDLNVLYLRILQRLDPASPTVRIQLGESLQRVGLAEAALREYAAVPEGPYKFPAEVDEIWLIGRLDRIPEATERARALVAETGQAEARLILADLLRVQSQCQESSDLYGEVIAERQAQGIESDWRYHYFRAACLQVIDRWEDAEAELQEAVRIAPDQAAPMNDLGYGWIDRGERIEEGFDLVRRATELDPSRGAYVDSLGWAHYRMANFDAAVVALERAVELSPGNATINFHLGDAYWQVGRRLEAGFQWRRALDLDPDPAERIALEDRLVNGLPDTQLAENGAHVEPDGQ